jgi:putative aminopeptidase FrvX
MDKQKTLAMIKEISDAPGVSGFEDEAVAALRRYSEGLGDLSEDAMRNLYLRRTGQKEGLPVLQIDAHSDEVGFMIRAIRPNGTLDFVTLGGWVPSNVPAHRELVRNQQGGWIPGIVASKPPHFLSEAQRKAAPEITDMVIDVGASSSREIREEYHIGIAAPVVPDVQFEYHGDRDTMIGKAFDNRLGSAAIIATLKDLAGAELGDNDEGPALPKKKRRKEWCQRHA